MKVLITGGTVFVSRYTAEYFVKKGHEVYVLNRNTRPQSEGVRLINCDRYNIGYRLKDIYFNLIILDVKRQMQKIMPVNAAVPSQKGQKFSACLGETILTLMT